MTREEAIEVYNGLINEKIKAAFEFFAPELRESEDERVRKSIVATIEQCPDDFLNPKNRDRMLAYLEKQKEQKPAEWSEKDEAMIKSILFVLESYVSHSESASSPSLITSYPTYYKEIDWLKSLPERFGLQPKQEWSEEAD